MPITQQQIQNAQNTQHTAAHDNSSQIRLVAGPGTGKSFAIEERIYWLINNVAPPNSIFVVSFTRAASLDLRNRIIKYCSQKSITTADQVSVTTLHSLALRILRSAGLLQAYPADPVVMDQWELDNIFDKEFSEFSKFRQRRCSQIRYDYEAYWSTGQWTPANYLPPDPPITSNERGLFEQFQGPRTQIYSCVLPGEVVHKCIDLITAGTSNPVQQLRIAYLVVDEYQDLNPCDINFVDHMIDRGVKTFVAGDDDQSIYSFRFASPSGIQEFNTKYPSSGIHTLTDCFRCTPNIINAADSLITSHSISNRISKSLNSVYLNSVPTLNGHIYRWRFPSHTAESQAIAESCRDLIQAGISPKDILILLSNKNALQQNITNALDVVNVHYELGRFKEYLESADGRFILAFLRIICNNNDYVAHRFLLSLTNGVGIGTCNSIAQLVLVNNLNFKDLFYQNIPTGVFNKRQLKAINATRNIINKFIAWNATDTLIQRKNDIEQLIQELFDPQAVQSWIDNISNLPNEITLQEIRDYFWANTEEHEQGILNSVFDRIDQPQLLQDSQPNRIRIMTMHGSKGLDAKIVFIPGLEEEILPGRWRIPYAGLVHEAARLLYMSITRAKIACILSYAQNRIENGRFMPGRTPSRFTSNLNGPFIYQNHSGLSNQEINTIVQDISNL